MKKYSYRVEIQYLGFRYHGWQKQGELRTLQLMVEKTLRYIRPGLSFKVLGASRTDARVSAQKMGFQLIIPHPLADAEAFLQEFDYNLPSDIRAFNIKAMPDGSSIIQSSTAKEYLYLFCYGPKPHPFAAALLGHFSGDLNISMMQKGARLFEGEHNFKKFCVKPQPGTQLQRYIDCCEIDENQLYQASFFPSSSYLLRVRSSGFLRYQIRLMMARLVELGRGEISLEELAKDLNDPDDKKLRHSAPGSGLVLQDITWKTKE